MQISQYIIMEIIQKIKTLKDSINIQELKPNIITHDVNNVILQYENNKPIGILNYKKNLFILKNNKLKCNFCHRNIQYCDNNNINYCWIHAHSLL
jgi:hypothetical protein